MLFSPRRQLEVVVRREGKVLTRCLIRRGRYVIGQDRKNEIVVDEPSISARHARLTVVSEEEIFIEDCDSSNGTYVDGQPAGEMTQIGAEARVQLGECTLDLQRGGLPVSIFPYLSEGFLRPNRYTLGESIVQGSTSTIYEAHDTSLDRDVAIKVMLPRSQADPAQVLRFIREAQITSQLQHPGIPPIYELSVDEQGSLYYTTRFMEGETLAAVLELLQAGHPETVERWTLGALLAVLQKACDAVAFAHSHGVVHCALRPENITIGDFGEVFVMGWAHAKILPRTESPGGAKKMQVRAPRRTAPPPLSPWTSPEQATNADDVDTLSDIYSLGGILYTIIGLHDPAMASDDADLLCAILNGQIAPITAANRGACPHWPGGRLPGPLAQIAMRALSAKRTERHAAVQPFQREISAWQEGRPAASETNGGTKKPVAVAAAK